MNLNWIDWTIMAVAVVSLRFVSLSTRKYMKGVADFLAANRCAGRYLLTIASQMGGIGVVSIVAGYEVLSSAGTAALWPTNSAMVSTTYWACASLSSG